MNALPWIIIVIFIILLAFVFNLWRTGVRDRRCLAEFAFNLMLHRDVYEVQRNNFLDLLKRLDAANSLSLGIRVMFLLSKHAAKLDQTGPNTALMWEIIQSAKHPNERKNSD